MKAWKLVLLAVLVGVALAFCRRPAPRTSNVRSVRPLPVSGTAGRLPFDPAQSAALFVGVRRFTSDPTVAEVPYAVDDAIDLAYAFALEPKASLVKANRVVLALSGEPHKRESKERLTALAAAGAAVAGAAQSDVVDLLQRQAQRAGHNGILILSFATHGFNSEGVPYVLTASSLLRRAETALSTTKILDVAATSDAQRSLVFIDACRERITAGTRAADPQLRSGAPLIDSMSKVDGQVVFYAAAAGKYAYDDDRAKNGVFTANVLAGLHCKAKADERGVVTVATLSEYVETHVRSWVQRHRDRSVTNAIQISMDGDTMNMPLAVCGSPPPPGGPPPTLKAPARVAIEGSWLEAFGDDGTSLWRRNVNGHIARAEVADLDGDHRKEVVAAVGGAIVVWNAAGEHVWSADTNAPKNYDGSVAAMNVHTFAIGDLFRKRTRQIIALSVDAAGKSSRITVFRGDGTLRSAYWHPGRLQQVVIARRTARHAPKIIVTGINHDLESLLNVKGPVSVVFMLDPNKVRGEAPPYRGKLGSGGQLWYGFVLPAGQRIDGIEIVDHDNDGKRDIFLRTTTGHIFLDFDGKTLEASHAHFELINPKHG